MRKLRIGLIFIVFAGIIPLLWLKTGHIIAKGDFFPFWMNPTTTCSTDFYLWTSENLGNPNSYPPYILYGLIWLFLRSLGFIVSFIQFFLQVFFFMGAGLSMYYLSKTVYPKLKLSPLISGIFYMFNFFVLQSRLNIGMAWTYTFLPLLMALPIKIVEATCQRKSKTANKNIIYLAITLTITLSFASINPANIIVIFLVLVATLLYDLITKRKRIRPLLLNFIKLITISILLNLWWTIAILNYYVWSPTALESQISVTSWSWTHSRASFLNLFWLNGGWGWRPEYFPYYDSYSNPILIILTFVPFLLAATALLFKTNKSHLNTYLMLFILIFIFLAKGLHEPLSQLNLLLYTYIPAMAMFREPTSKFIMALMPFIALLVGYAVDNIANIKIGKHKPSALTKMLIAAFFILTFIISSYPLVTNPIETKTTQLPFSSYINIPNYWHEAIDWLNNQPGDYKILVTPPDDFYQMPYTWGYYGTDSFLPRLIQKPILSNYYAYSYKTNPKITANLQQLSATIRYNKTSEFKALLDLLNIKYILQRNDIQYNLTERHITPPNQMRTFLTQQPYIHLTQKFGELDIYEYDNPKPYIYVLDPTILQKTTIRIENITVLERSWNFNSQTNLQEWQDATPENQWQATHQLSLDNGALKAELWNSTWGWKTVDSPLISAKYGNSYQIQIDIKGRDAHQVHLKIAEYNADKEITMIIYVAFINEGTFNWTHTTFDYEPANENTEYLQIQVWHGHETDKPFPNIIWIDNAKIRGYTIALNTTGLDLIFQNAAQNQPAKILNYRKMNPTKIVAEIDAQQPFVLAISEAIDQFWTAHINGKKFETIPLYLGLKGFYINQTGKLEITMEYEPQKWFYYSSIISVTTLLACLTYLIYNWTKSQTIWKQLRTILKLSQRKL